MGWNGLVFVAGAPPQENLLQNSTFLRSMAIHALWMPPTSCIHDYQEAKTRIQSQYVASRNALMLHCFRPSLFAVLPEKATQ